MEEILKGCFGDKNSFTIGAFKEISKNLNPNYVMSPFTVEIILKSLTDHPEESSGTVRSLLEDDTYTLKVANKIYVSQNYKIKNNFKNRASFLTDLENIDLREAARNVNEWVEKKTDKKIKNILEKVNEDTKVILISALYFRTNWTSSFIKQLTFQKDFYITDEESVKVDTMQGLSSLNYYEFEEVGAKLVELPLRGEAKIGVVLPNQKGGLEAVEDKIQMIFQVGKEDFKEELIRLELPKFKIETHLDFKNCFQNISVKKILESYEDLYVTDFLHKVVVHVHEEGVDAAAAVPVDLSIPFCAFIPEIPAKKFIVDHPFLFYIKVKGVLIFIGRVKDPSS